MALLYSFRKIVSDVPFKLAILFNQSEMFMVDILTRQRYGNGIISFRSFCTAMNVLATSFGGSRVKALGPHRSSSINLIVIS